MVPFKLTICGLSELEDFKRAGVSHVLSILDPPEPEPPAFFEFDTHRRLELRFHDVIEETRGFDPPRPEHVERLLDFGRRMDEEAEPTHLLVHCHMGVSRSTASMLLLLAQARPDQPADAIADEIVRVRPIAWPNLRMVTFGDALLGRKGELIEAARGIYRRRAIVAPEVKGFIKEAGRTAELDGLD